MGNSLFIFAVASLVEAWIEIIVVFDGRIFSKRRFPRGSVDWNTILTVIGFGIIESLPSWKRGLKYQMQVLFCMRSGSLPSWKRGLKFKAVPAWLPLMPSLPSWKRGLKYQAIQHHQNPELSLPSWKRGLKYVKQFLNMGKISRFPRGSVDWNMFTKSHMRD